MCKVLPRVRAPFFNGAASILNQYLCGVLEPIPNVFCWRHRGFDNPSVHPYLPDGVHVNSFGQYCLYRSYRGTILKALRMLSSSLLDMFSGLALLIPLLFIYLVLLFS